jgi:hypothetical protein
MKILDVAIVCNIPPCSLYVNRRFEGTYHLHLHDGESEEQETSVQQVPSHTLVSTSADSRPLKTEIILSCETPTLIWATLHYIPYNDNFHNYRYQNFKYYKEFGILYVS